MRVRLRNPDRTVHVPGPMPVDELLRTLGIRRESVLVIANDELVPSDRVLDDADVVEIRPVISGGST